jgi:chromosome segregation ATPase
MTIEEDWWGREDWKHEAEAAREERDALMERVEALKVERDRHHEILALQTNAQHMAERQVKQLKAERDALDKKVETLWSDVKFAKAEAETLEDERDALAERVRALEDGLEHQSSHKLGYMGWCEQLEAARDTARGEHRLVVERLAVVMHEVEQARMERDEARAVAYKLMMVIKGYVTYQDNSDLAKAQQWTPEEPSHD